MTRADGYDELVRSGPLRTISGMGAFGQLPGRLT